MKIRTGFVSNSSSSSFIITKGVLTEEQIYKIVNHMKVATEYCKQNNIKKGKYGYDSEFGYVSNYDNWNITEENDFILADTSMDNFNLYNFLKYIRVPEDFIFDGEYTDIDTIRQKVRQLKIEKITKDLGENYLNPL